MKYISEIELLLHELSINNLNNKEEIFISNFELLNDLLSKQFLEENISLFGSISNKSMVHKLEDDYMSNKFINYKRVVCESTDKRILIVSKIETWLIKHIEEFHS
ncbi:MAG: hypothetical protein COA79_26610 [Planctomycetota bacterium]|nr:MAG: hypothetical protein COA79_26610 [Planctomycetota bacterium]